MKDANMQICDALRDFVPFVYSLKNVENTHGGVLILVLKVTLLHGCFSHFLNCTNGTKSRNASHISPNFLTHFLSQIKISETFTLNKFQFLVNFPINVIVQFTVDISIPFSSVK